MQRISYEGTKFDLLSRSVINKTETRPDKKVDKTHQCVLSLTGHSQFLDQLSRPAERTVVH